MKKSKYNRVSWAPDVKLCQVKLFVSDDCPSKAGVKPPDLQGRRSSILHPRGQDPSYLPPGFEASDNKSGEHLSCIPCIEWKSPAKFVICHSWHVAAGEESKEAESQKRRQMRVLEAIYPRSSAIPPSPHVSLDVEKEHYSDGQTPLIPIIPIEEEEGTMDISSNLTAPVNTPISSLPLVMPQGSLSSVIPNTLKCETPALKPPANEKPALGTLVGQSNDYVVAASAALTTFMKCIDQRNIIDTDLLVKILSDPKMIEKLSNDNRAPATAGSAPMHASEQASELGSEHCPKLAMVSSPTHRNLSHVSNGVRPTVDLAFPQPVIVPVSVSKPSVPSSSSQASISLVSRLANGNLFPASKHQAQSTLCIPAQLNPSPVVPAEFNSLPKVQPAPSIMPAQTNSALKVQHPLNMRPLRPSSVPKVQSTLYMGPLQPCSVPKVQPMSSKMPLQPNSASVSSLAKSVKDANYFKQLIREHGRQNQQIHDSITSNFGNHDNHLQDLKLVHNLKVGELKPKYQKPCIYFRSQKGCRNGANCPYLHDVSFPLQTGNNILQAPNAKRIKLSGEISGRT
ncbi:hypothetical protein CFOL_v3_17833 [Cephalotus follicularis]|uniref:C3H1-type domain-containing protein n=1 Tax=Cephalotus follicularis TaxID=3775 RepID=A0A1Q3C2W0_CEPFO|nr:hypothetical protein CFOL_v3_17833 [Cephalotus follicularis]